MEYTYSLQKYTGRDSRHTCPACGRKFCFVLYVNAAGNPLSEDVGRCEHRNTCGYERTPKEYFSVHPEERETWKPQPMPKNEPKKTDYVPFFLIQRSESADNTLMYYLRRYFDDEAIKQVTAAYHLGSTKKREIIFPQIDRAGMCRTGKVMQYGVDGHRIKGAAFDYIDWLHARLMKKHGKAASDFHLRQCLFGEHLLPKRPGDIVCLVEGEKTAVIASMMFPQFVWVSCGGKQGLTAERCKALAGRDVIVYADADAVDEWAEKAKALSFCRSVKLSDWANDEAPGSKRDIADVLLQERKQKAKHATVGDVCGWMAELGIPKNRVTFNL